MIVADKELSVCEQSLLLGVARSSYYQKSGVENGLNMGIMRRMDELYTADPRGEAVRCEIGCASKGIP